MTVTLTQSKYDKKKHITTGTMVAKEFSKVFVKKKPIQSSSKPSNGLSTTPVHIDKK